MSVAIDQTCNLCGGPTMSFEQGVHAACMKVEQFDAENHADPNGRPCDLCGEPTMPFERGVHATCMLLEKAG